MRSLHQAGGAASLKLVWNDPSSPTLRLFLRGGLRRVADAELKRRPGAASTVISLVSVGQSHMFMIRQELPLTKVTGRDR
jgi:hypothetical protein